MFWGMIHSLWLRADPTLTAHYRSAVSSHFLSVPSLLAGVGGESQEGERRRRGEERKGKRRRRGKRRERRWERGGRGGERRRTRRRKKKLFQWVVVGIK